jgi:uncharacterized membrane protein HdeD (DUF308 family)
MKNKINQWWILVIIGLLLSGIGIFLMTKPVGTFIGLTIMFGWLIFSVGGMNLVFAIRNKSYFKDWVWYLLLGIVEMLIGAALLFQPELSASSLIIFTGMWMMFTAVSRINGAIVLKKLGDSYWGAYLILGILTFLFSFLIIINPIFAMFAIVYSVAIPMILAGITIIYFGIQLKKITE